jgi:3-oxoacyl-[acyl-carrier protein] reductase
MNLNLVGKNALVCGSSKGIGKAAAIELSKLGANIILVSRSAEKMVDVLRELDLSHQDEGQDHNFLVADFSQPDDLKKKVHNLVRVKPIHILVNNTGGPPGGPIIDATIDSFLQAYNNHLVCNHLLTQAVAPRMKEEGYGRIINVISTSVRIPIDGLGVSNTTRGAVASWAKTMANELGPDGITVNNVLPGFTATDRLTEIVNSWAEKKGVSIEEQEKAMANTVPLRRFGSPEEVASAIAFLASPAAAYITGTSMIVDGGRTRSI